MHTLHARALIVRNTCWITIGARIKAPPQLIFKKKCSEGPSSLSISDYSNTSGTVEKIAFFLMFSFILAPASPTTKTRNFEKTFLGPLPLFISNYIKTTNIGVKTLFFWKNVQHSDETEGFLDFNVNEIVIQHVSSIVHNQLWTYTSTDNNISWYEPLPAIRVSFKSASKTYVGHFHH